MSKPLQYQRRISRCQAGDNLWYLFQTCCWCLIWRPDTYLWSSTDHGNQCWARRESFIWFVSWSRPICPPLRRNRLEMFGLKWMLQQEKDIQLIHHYFANNCQRAYPFYFVTLSLLHTCIISFIQQCMIYKRELVWNAKPLNYEESLSSILITHSSLKLWDL